MTKRRRPWLAGVANLFVPPLGHVYAGRPLRGVGVSVAVIACANVALFGALYAPSFLSDLLLASPLFGWLTIVTDAVLVARSAGPYQLRRFNRWYVYVAIAIAMPLIGGRLAAFSRRDLVQAYRTPAGSMSPTLMIGDHFLANKLAYRVGEPRRFDVVVFQDPTDATRTFVKRVIGMPGDTVQIEDGRLQLNGAPMDERYATSSSGGATAHASGSWRVPGGEYFVLGDFRSASVDSRRLGGIPRDKIWGRVQRIYWSWDAVRHAVRWDRVGTPVN